MPFLYWLFCRNNFELKIVSATLLVLISLPMAAVAVITTTGVAAVSSAIATVNPETKEVTILDPNGNQIVEVKLQTIWPTRGYTSSEYGSQEAERTRLGLGAHTGLDIANDFGLVGEPVYAFLDGKVIDVEPRDKGTCGVYVKIRHDNNIDSLYCHLLIPEAVEGDEVKQGERIGLMGSSGASTGAHLHFQINIGDIPVNPRLFLNGKPERSSVRAVIPNF